MQLIASITALAALAVPDLGPPRPSKPEGPDWRVGVEALTDVPIQVGARLEVESPGRVRFGAGLGVVPEAYVSLINEIGVGVGAYDEGTAALIEAALQNSLLVHVHLGYRPLADEGFYVDVGYGVATLGGGISGSELAAVSIGTAPPAEASATGIAYDLGATVHQLDLKLGWAFDLGEGWRLRLALGGTFTVAAEVAAEPDFDPLFPQLWEPFSRSTETYLEDIFVSYVHTPTLSLALGYRLQ